MTGTKTLELKACYSKAWKSFSKWWLPLCLLAGFLLVFEWIPRLSSRAESQQLVQTVSEIVAAAENDQFDRMDRQLMELNEILSAYAKKMLTFALYASPFIALLSVLLVATALMAVRNRRSRLSPKRVAVVAVVQFALALAKVLLLFLFFPLGVFVYIKLYFAILLMLEEDRPAAEAIKESWSMGTGNFWSLLGLVSINGAIQFFMGLTVVGLIPATGFAQTTRAAAFDLLKNPGQ